MDRDMQSCYKRVMLPLMLGKEDFARRENDRAAPGHPTVDEWRP